MEENMEELEKYYPQIIAFLKKYTRENNKLSEEVKKNTLDDIEPAIKDFTVYFGEELKILKKHYPDIEKAFYEYIERMYDQAPTRTEGLFHKQVCGYFLLQSLKMIIKEEVGLWNRLKDNINTFCKEHPYFSNIINMVINQYYLEESFLIISDDTVDKTIERLQPVNIKSVDGQINLYHGTCIETYKRIIEDGYLIPTNYVGLKRDTYVQAEKVYSEKYNKMQTGYCFFSADLSYVLGYAIDRQGLNAIGISTSNSEDERNNEEIIDSRLNSDGVIFVIDPKKYIGNLYYVPSNNEFMIKGNVDIRDVRVIFVHRNKGKILLTNEKGDVINDLCYE